MNTMVKARLDKTGLRVLCGVIDCGTELALVLEVGVSTKDGWPRAVWFPPGWSVRKDGVWHRSRKRHRSPPLELARWEGPCGWLPLNLPIEAVCPCRSLRCCGGMRQVLDPDVLRVDPNHGSPQPEYFLTPAIPRALDMIAERGRYPTPKSPR